MNLKSILACLCLFVFGTSFSQNEKSLDDLRQLYPSGTSYFDGLNYSGLSKSYIHVDRAEARLVVNGSNIKKREIVYKHGKPNESGQRPYTARVEMQGDSMFNNRSRTDQAMEDYYVLIPSKGYIVHYTFQDENIVLKHVYIKDKSTAKSFNESNVLIQMIEKQEKKIELVKNEQTLLSDKESKENESLPPTIFKDAALEADLRKIVQSYIEREELDLTITNVIITSDYWLDRNEYSGRIIARYVELTAIGTKGDGSCGFKPFSFKQDAIDNSGAKYGNWGLFKTSYFEEIGCEKIK